MTLESCSKTGSDASRPSFLSTVVGTSNFRRGERKGGRLVAGRLLFRLLPALVASTGMTTFGEILSLRHGTSLRETPDIKDGITFPTLLTRDVAIRLLHGWPATCFFFNILISFLRESHLIWMCRSRLSQLLSLVGSK